MKKQKCKKVFISHASKDEAYVRAIVVLLEDMGLTERQVVCSSIPGYGIPLGEDIYEWLAKQFRDFDLHVLFVLSDNYYSSVACQNEMGASWVLKTKYDTILLPGFEYRNIKGAVNPNQISIKLDGNKEALKQHLNELKDTLITEFGLTMPSASKWERNQKAFLDTISLKEENNPNTFGLMSQERQNRSNELKPPKTSLRSSDRDKFRSMLEVIYPITCEYRNALRNGDEKQINLTAHALTEKIQQLYYLGEKNRVQDKALMMQISFVVQKFNDYILYYNQFINAQDRSSDAAQKAASQAEKNFNGFVEQVVADLSAE